MEEPPHAICTSMLNPFPVEPSSSASGVLVMVSGVWYTMLKIISSGNSLRWSLDKQTPNHSKHTFETGEHTKHSRARDHKTVVNQRPLKLYSNSKQSAIEFTTAIQKRHLRREEGGRNIIDAPWGQTW